MTGRATSTDQADPPGGLRARSHDIWLRYTRRPALWWTDHVSYRIGAWIVAIVADSGVTPDRLTIAGAITAAIGALVLLAWTAPGIAAAVVVGGLWQLAYAFDCADGQLARSRQTTSEFGAWLDQLADFVAHAFVFLALSSTLARSLALPADLAAAIGVGLFAANMLQGYAIALKARSAIPPRGLSHGASGFRGVVALGLHLTDYGLLLFIACVLLVAPPLLLAYLLLSGLLSVAAVTVQVIGYRSA